MTKYRTKEQTIDDEAIYSGCYAKEMAAERLRMTPEKARLIAAIVNWAIRTESLAKQGEELMMKELLK